MLSRVIAWGLFRAGQLRRRLGMALATRLHAARLGGLGAGSRIAAGVVFWPPEDVRIGVGCLIQKGVGVASELESGALDIGDRVQINRGVHLDMTGGLRIGDDVLISEGAVLYTHDHGIDPHAAPHPCPKTVGARVWIGARALVLPGCRSIGAGAVIGAGSVVTRDVPEGAVVAGNPARIINRLEVAA